MRAAILVACAVAALAVQGAMAEAPPAADSAVGGKTPTDTTTAARERASMRSGAQQFQYQAEVNRLLDILIHSLYSNKDIFLRELISNASDALDKIRFLSLTDKSVLGDGDTAELEMKIWLDKESNVLNIRDRGIGMTHDDLIKNLGTIAKSGTSAFLEQMQKGGDINLIGQFGVGFYSVYLVADWVEVVTKHNDDKQYVWASSADGSFTVAEDTETEPLGRGTLIKIHLKSDAQEYAEEAKLQSLVQRYSEFINFPIKLLVEKEVEVKDEEDKAEDSADVQTEDTSDDDAEDVVDDDEEEKKEPKAPKKEKRQVWEVLNQAKPLWLRSPGDVSSEEYASFYKAISKDYQEPLAWSHFKAEGDVEFRSILFIPKTAPYDFFEKYYEKQSNGPKLYVRRVFISDDVSELLPKYLSFLKGVVDSDTLPLNVSREMLQQHSSLKTIRKKLIRKVLDVIKKLADDESKCNTLPEGDESRPSPDECSAFATFWKEYGRAIKLGMMEDANNRSRLAKLLRFQTSSSPDKLTTLEEYVSRMKEGQSSIYWVAGQDMDEVKKSPFTETLVSKGYEVIYFTDVLDEYVMQQLTEFEDHKFANVAKEDIKVDSDKDAEKAAKEAFKPLVKWWKGKLEGKAAGVKVSFRLTSTPCVVVTGKYGSSANMERILKAQAFGDPSRMAAMRGQRTLEINPKHPLIAALKEKVAAGDDEAGAEAAAKLLFEAALIESGYSIDDTKSFASAIQQLLAGSLGVDASSIPSPTPSPAAAVEQEDDDRDEL